MTRRGMGWFRWTWAVWLAVLHGLLWGGTGAFAAPRLAAGGQHSVVVRPDGTVWAAGLNDAGQLGDGTTTSRAAPVQVLALATAVSVSAGANFSLAILKDGSVWAWGGQPSWPAGRWHGPVECSARAGEMAE